MLRDQLIKSLEDGGMRRDQAEWEADDVLQTVDRAGYRLITKDRYNEWAHDSRLLAILESNGVDNWEGWSESLNEAGER